MGVGRQESLFNPWVTSHAGAQGLLQLMPRTAFLMARQLGAAYNRGLLSGDPDYNVRLGSHYLKTLLKRYDGEVALAVAAYNAGPARVDEWVRLHGDPRRRDRHHLVDWVELIPFDETRNYVQRVLEGRNMYQRRLAAKQGNHGLVPAGQRSARAGAGGGAEAARRGRADHDRRAGGQSPQAAAKPDVAQPLTVVPAEYQSQSQVPPPERKPEGALRLRRVPLPEPKPEGALRLAAEH